MRADSVKSPDTRWSWVEVNLAALRRNVTLRVGAPHRLRRVLVARRYDAPPGHGREVAVGVGVVRLADVHAVLALVADDHVVRRVRYVALLGHLALELGAGIGMGVAIPHGKSSGVNQTALAIGTSKKPIEWESLEDEAVTVVILFAVTDGDSDVLHIKLLQHVAMLLAHESFAEKLHAVKTPAEMLALLESSPDDYDD